MDWRKALNGMRRCSNGRPESTLRFECKVRWCGMTGPQATHCFRIVQEALTNAAKHSGSKTAEIALTFTDATLSDLDPRFGAGIPAARKKQTPGLGLIAMHERAEILFGKLDVSSKPGEGTTVSLTMPLYQEQDDTGGVGRHGRNERGSLSRIMSEDITVLLADDHSLVRRGFRRILEDDERIKVVGEASNGVEAIRMSYELKPKVVVMDLSMPELDGVQATKEIVKHLPGDSGPGAQHACRRQLRP